MKRPEFGFFKSNIIRQPLQLSKAGCWELQRAKAISLFPEVDSALTIKQGSVWATLDAGSDDRAKCYGDHFLSVGESLLAHKGQHVVFESTQGNLPVFFDFTPV
jgi:hypothetical protein